MEKVCLSWGGLSSVWQVLGLDNTVLSQMSELGSSNTSHIHFAFVCLKLYLHLPHHQTRVSNSDVEPVNAARVSST